MTSVVHAKNFIAKRNAPGNSLELFAKFLEMNSPETDFMLLQLRIQGLTKSFENYDAICDESDTTEDNMLVNGKGTGIFSCSSVSHAT